MKIMRCYYVNCPGWDENTPCLHDPWRRLTQTDLTNLPPETPIRINGKVKGTIGHQRDLYLPGHYPFLLGMQAFWTIEVPDERLQAAESGAGPRFDVDLSPAAPGPEWEWPEQAGGVDDANQH